MALVVTVISVNQVYAQPIINPDNGNYYEYIHGDISWFDANFIADRTTFHDMRGHLATISSHSENQFISNLVFWGNQAWIGLHDSQSEGTFKWIDGEPLTYSNWSPGEPSGTNCTYCKNNHNSNEDFVSMYGGNGKWNDATNDNIGYKTYDNTSNPYYYPNNQVTGFVIEYQIPRIQPIFNPQNGHYYDFISIPGISWSDSNIIIDNLPQYNGLDGHLVTITSESEQEFISDMITQHHRPWIGLTDRDSEGEFKWVTGEPFDYNKWRVNQPDNYKGDEHYVHLFGNESTWNDNRNGYEYSSGFIVEFTPSG